MCCQDATVEDARGHASGAPERMRAHEVVTRLEGEVVSDRILTASASRLARSRKVGGFSGD